MVKEKLEAVHQESKKYTGTYAQAAATAPLRARGSSTVQKPPKQRQQKTEVVLIKPKEENDKRTNEELRTQITTVLEVKRKDLKVTKIRQLRTKGMLTEVKDKKYVTVIKDVNFDSIGLSTAETTKIDPSIIIYDVEKELKPDELKADLVSKNFDKIDEGQDREIVNR